MSSLTFPAAQGAAAAESREVHRAGISRRPGPALRRQPAPVASTRRRQPSASSSSGGEAGPSLWFAKDTAFDRRFRERLLSTARGGRARRLDGWLATAIGALALILLLDQFPRNAFRGTPRMYATDAKARAIGRRRYRCRSRPRRAEGAAALHLSAVRPFGGPGRPGALGRTGAAARRAGSVACKAAPRHRPPLRPLSASQSDPRTRHDDGRTALSRRGRLRRG